MKTNLINSIETGTHNIAGPHHPTEAEKGEFGNALEGMIGKVDAMQLEADQQARAVANGDGNLHELSLSLEKADIAMRTAVKARNKLVDAYNEVMRMTV